MKKLFICLFVIGIGLGLLRVFNYDSPLDRISDEISVDLKNSKVMKNEDTFGWFNDGEQFIEIKLNDSFDYTVIETSWNKLPFSNDLINLTDYVLPEIKDGYYYIESKNNFSNYTVVLIDKTNNTMYYYKYNS